MKFRNHCIILIIILLGNLYPQGKIINESVNGNRYELQISLDPVAYKIKNYNKINIIEFVNYFDESKPGYFTLPKSDIFIAIPPNSNPKINAVVLNRKKINAEPKLNPEIHLSADSTLKYSEALSPKFNNNSDLFEVKGFLWINNVYSLHIQLNHYSYSYSEKVVYENNEFKIELTFNSNLISLNKENNSVEINNYIINKNFAQNYISKPQHLSADNSDSWIDYSKTYLKVGVFKDGIYRIDYNDLINMGINVSSINPQTFSLRNKGKEEPIYIFGEDDNQFNPGDYIEFTGIRNMGGNHREVAEYGEPYNEYLGRYTDTTIYWLTWGGDSGLRVDVFNGIEELISNDTLDYYSEIIHLETNNWFDFSEADLVRREMPYWTENKSWFDGQIRVGTKNTSFNVTDVYPDEPLLMFTKVQDYATEINFNSHLLGISLNNFPQVYDSSYINKYETAVLKGELNSSQLNSGANTFRIHSFSTSAQLNACQLDWIEVEYPRYLYPYDDSLNFAFKYLNNIQTSAVRISNITTSTFSLWKYGESYTKYEIPINNNQLIFVDSISSKNKFSFSTESKIAKPVFYYVKQFKNLRSGSNQADYLAITHKKFLTNVEDYSEFIEQNYNVSALAVDIDDIYDEFSFGYFNPESIKDFLKSSHIYWQNPLPKYATLIGAATYDYYGNKTKNFDAPKTYNYVPSFGASASDNWFITWDSTDAFIPQMNIGRIPVNSVEEFQRYFSKHINFISKEYDEWNKDYMFFSGGKTSSQQELNQLKSVNDYVINNFVKPPSVGGNYNHFYRTLNPPTNFGPFTQTEVQTAINKGAIIISYLGHSGTRTWDNSIVNHTQLKNLVDRNPLITDFGCSTARFAEPDIISFSQLFVLGEEGQAINYIGNSSLGFLSTSLNAPKIFYKKIFHDSVYNVSEALNLAKVELQQTYGSSGVYKLFSLTSTLIGDPIISLQIPAKPNLVIKASGIKLLDEFPSDNQDSLKVIINYNNLGSVTNDSILIIINNEFSGSINFTANFKKAVPLYDDSLTINIPIRNLAGEHKLTVQIDAGNEIDEIYENDNTISLLYNVASSSLRNNLVYNLEKSVDSSFIILNSTLKPLSDSIVIQFSNNENFINADSLSIKIDTFYTKINLYDLGNLIENNRYWFRAKIKGESSYNAAQSFYFGNNDGFYLNDSLSFSSSEKKNLIFKNNVLTLDTNETVLQVFSAGFNDGNTALILKNGVNFIPENTLSGHHVVLFEDSTFNFISYNRFTASDANYITFLDTLNSNIIVAIAVSDNGPVSNVNLKNQIKSLGSIYIDSLQFRGSWAIIGKKGSASGSVPEAFSNPFEGSVEINQTIKTPLNNGYFITPLIGPAVYWNELNVVQSINSPDEIKYRIIGFKNDGSSDTLNYLNMQNGIVDLNVDPLTYPKIKIKGEILSNNNLANISSLFIDYISVPEIGMNYQTVILPNDTLEANQSYNFRFDLYNVGESSADSFKVIVNLLKPDNTTRTIYEIDNQSLLPFNKKEYIIDYNPISSDGNGNMSFIINADDDNKLTELFKDNNIFRKSFYLKADTTSTSVSESTFAVTFDGKEILDGDFISPNPEIKMELNYPIWFPYTDTNSVQFYLGTNQIFYSQIEAKEYDTVNRKINYIFKPNLKSGEYTLRVFGTNSLGQLDQNPGIEKSFLVSENSQLLNVYNYPNPFAKSTFFTFKLTQVPEELFIKIFTISGRLIKEIKKTSSELTTDFNTIEWDGRDEDGDLAANGVYLYKVIIKKNGDNDSVIQKLAIVR